MESQTENKTRMAFPIDCLLQYKRVMPVDSVITGNLELLAVLKCAWRAGNDESWKLQV